MAHRLYKPEWSDAKNLEVFGICSNLNLHGHNYDLEVKVSGHLDPNTGILMNLKVLKDIIHEHVELRFEHKNLNLDLEEFKTKVPIAENILVEIYNILRKQIYPNFDIQIRLYETARNFVEYPA